MTNTNTAEQMRDQRQTEYDAYVLELQRQTGPLDPARKAILRKTWLIEEQANIKAFKTMAKGLPAVHRELKRYETMINKELLGV